MANVSVIKLKVRRGTDAQRQLIVLDQGEIGYTTDSKRLFIGDVNGTQGGVPAGIKYYTTTTSYINIPGYMMDKTSNVYLQLSGSTIYSSGTAVTLSAFTYNPKVSALFPTLTAYNYPNFSITDKNHVLVNLYGLSGNGYADIIIYNQAGYTRISTHNFLVRISS